MTEPTEFSVIIPAHNEEAVIRQCLESMRQDAPPGHAMQIIVAANGCTDNTVNVARDAAPEAEIIDLSRGSKTAAINAANDVAAHFPRIVLDADVICSYRTLRALALALKEPGVMTAAPAIRLDMDGTDRLIRGYYRIWMRQPFAKAGKGGAGCYGLSRAALRQIGKFPDIIGDDIWIHTRFPDEEKRYVDRDEQGEPVFTVVRPPQNAWQQLRVEARRVIGTRQVLARYPSPYNFQSGGAGGLRQAIGNASSLLDLFAFAGLKLSARLLAKWQTLIGRGAVWTRDSSSRQA